MTTTEFLLVVGMALVTFATRYPVLALVSKATLPPPLLAALRFIPPAVLTAIIVPAVLAPDGGPLEVSLTNPNFLAALIATMVAWRTKNLLLTLGIGMAALWIWRFLLAWLPVL